VQLPVSTAALRRDDQFVVLRDPSAKAAYVAAVWEDEEWPPGDDLVTLASECVARNAAPHIHTARLVPELYLPLEVVWREDDDSPILHRVLEVATPSPPPEPAAGS
jgi:hypothetical protein